jgi:hypothetical protein
MRHGKKRYDQYLGSLLTICQPLLRRMAMSFIGSVFL